MVETDKTFRELVGEDAYRLAQELGQHIADKNTNLDVGIRAVLFLLGAMALALYQRNGIPNASSHASRVLSRAMEAVILPVALYDTPHQ